MDHRIIEIPEGINTDSKFLLSEINEQIEKGVPFYYHIIGEDNENVCGKSPKFGPRLVFEFNWDNKKPLEGVYLIEGIQTEDEDLSEFRKLDIDDTTKKIMVDYLSLKVYR